MLSGFDYIYYRIYRFCVKQGDNLPETKATAVLSVMQFFTLLSAAAFLTFVVTIEPFNKYYTLVVMIPLYIINWYRYERSVAIDEFDAKWKNENPSEKKRRGWLLVIYFAIVLLIPISIGVLRHNLGLI